MYDDKFFIDKYIDGNSAYFLSKMTGVSKSKILTILHKNNVEIRHNTISKECSDKIMDLFKNGESVNAIAKKLSISTYPIYRLLKENGYEYESLPQYYEKKKKLAVQDYINGVPVSEILKNHGISYGCLHNGLNDNGVRARTVVYNKIPEDIRSMIVLEYNEGSNICELHEKYGYGTTTIARWVHADSKMRSLSDAFSLSAEKGRKHFRGKNLPFISKKNGKTFFADSTYEYARMKQLEDDESVTSWSKLVPRIQYKTSDGKLHYYMPDFIVTKDGKVFIEEIKPSTLISTKINCIKFKAAKKFCKNNKMQFLVLTENDIGVNFINSIDYEGVAKLTMEERKKHRNNVRNTRLRKQRNEKRNTTT